MAGFLINIFSLFPFGTSWGISWRNNPINPLDFLRAVDSSRPPRPRPEGDERVDFAAVRPEEVLKSIQEVVAASGPALSAVRR